MSLKCMVWRKTDILKALETFWPVRFFWQMVLIKGPMRPH